MDAAHPHSVPLILRKKLNALPLKRLCSTASYKKHNLLVLLLRLWLWIAFSELDLFQLGAHSQILMLEETQCSFY